MGHLGSEPIQFHSILQSFIVFKGGHKNDIAEKEIPDETYSEEGVALFLIQGSGPDNMQAIQIEPVRHLVSLSCFLLKFLLLLHTTRWGHTVFTWTGSFTNSDDQELVERMLDLIKRDLQITKGRCRI